MSNQLSVVDGGQQSQMVQSSRYQPPMPQNIGEIAQLATAFAVSNMFGTKSKEQAMVVLMTGMELGFAPAQSMRGIHVINGKPSLSADMMVAVCKNRPEICAYFQLVKSDADGATYKTQRIGEPEPVTMSFTREEAKAAGLMKNPTWSAYPAAMCRARAASALARAVYSDLILGLYTEEEAQAIQPINITPAYANSEPQVVSEIAAPSRKEAAAALAAALKAVESPARRDYWKKASLKLYGEGMKNATVEQIISFTDDVKNWIDTEDNEPAAAPIDADYKDAPAAPVEEEEDDDPFSES